MLQDVFATNCVAVVFLIAVLANLLLPQDISIDGAPSENVESEGAEPEA